MPLWRKHMESWDSTKINKYLALKTTTESNGWSVELFAVEVGARGYCSKSALYCPYKYQLTYKLLWNNF